jgi:predicted PurR-regulated permease PerM
MSTKRIIRIILALLGLVLLAWVLWKARQIALYFGISMVLALVGRPLMKLLGRIQIRGKHLPASLSAGVVLITYLVLIVTSFLIFIPKLSKQVSILSTVDPQQLLSALESYIDYTENWLQSMNITKFNKEAIEAQVTDYLDFSLVTNVFDVLVSSVGNVLIGFMSILFITFFLLKDRNIINNIVDALTPDQHLKSIHNVMGETKDLLSRYFIGIVIQVSLVSAVITVGLSLVGVPNALLIGILAGLFNIIPYLGPIIGGLVAISLSVLSHLNLHMDVDLILLVGQVVIVTSVAQLLDNFVLQPLIFSKSVKAHPLEIFIVIILGGSIAGIPGMILAVPVYTFIRIIAKEFFQGYKVVQGLTKSL